MTDTDKLAALLREWRLMNPGDRRRIEIGYASEGQMNLPPNDYEFEEEMQRLREDDSPAVISYMAAAIIFWSVMALIIAGIAWLA